MLWVLGADNFSRKSKALCGAWGQCPYLFYSCSYCTREPHNSEREGGRETKREKAWQASPKTKQKYGCTYITIQVYTCFSEHPTTKPTHKIAQKCWISNVWSHVRPAFAARSVGNEELAYRHGYRILSLLCIWGGERVACRAICFYFTHV